MGRPVVNIIVIRVRIRIRLCSVSVPGHAIQPQGLDDSPANVVIGRQGQSEISKDDDQCGDDYKARLSSVQDDYVERS